MAEKPFIIAGGGIGGLAAALGLAKAGKHSLVLEQAERLGEIGAGIQIAPNAFNCFDFLGIGGALRENAVYIDRLRLMDALSGEEICHIPLDEDFRERFGNPYAVVHRADLHLALLEACRSSGKVEMRTRHAVCGYRQDENTVFVQVENRDEIEGTALIGADGLRSAVRRQMLDDDPPRVSGHTTYRSVIPTESMPEDLRWNAATLWAGPKCHIVHYPLKGWKVFNLVVTFHNDVREAVAGKPVSREEVEQGFEHIHPRPKQVIDHGTDWKLWVLCDRDPVRNWVDGRVALLGDFWRDFGHSVYSTQGIFTVSTHAKAIRFGQNGDIHPDIYLTIAATRCCSILPRGPAWPWKTRSVFPTAAERKRTSTKPSPFILKTGWCVPPGSSLIPD